MKHQIFLIITFLVMISNLFAQNFEPAQHQFNYKGSTVYLDRHSDFRALDTTFNLLWHWYSGKKMSKALGVNLVHISPIDFWGRAGNTTYLYCDTNDLRNVADSVHMIMNSNRFSHGCPDLYSPTYGIMMDFEPTIIINTSDPYVFVRRQFDTTRPVFGFMNVKGTISNSQTDPNYNRMVYRQRNHTGNEIILSDPWPSDVLAARIPTDPHTGAIIYNPDRNIYTTPYQYPGYHESRVDSMLFEEDSGINFYLSLNMRRINIDDIQMNDDTLLVIRMPYVLKDTTITGFIRFDSIPKPNSAFPLPLNRGNALELEKNNNSFREFYITRRMLPPGNYTDKDITISAHFVCDNIIVQGNNPYLKDYPGKANNEMINTLKIEVESIDHDCDFAIDWIRIENRPARELYRGYWDSILIEKMQHDLDVVTDTNGYFHKKGLKPYRWYLVDEAGWDRSFYWGAYHYLSKLCGSIFTYEVGPLPPHYKHYVNYHEKWNGMRNILAWRRSPWLPGIQNYYSGLENEPWKYWGVSDGFVANDIPPDQMEHYLSNSGYETLISRPDQGYWQTDYGLQIPHNDDMLRNFGTFERLQIAVNTNVNYGRGILFHVESLEYDQYINKKYNSFLYDTLSWWGQINLDGRFKHKDASNLWIYKDYNGYRQMTGEEVRSFTNEFVLFGAKGISVDGEKTNYDWGNLAINLHSGQDSIDVWGMNDLPPLEFLLKDSIGGDFINFTDGTDPLRDRVMGDSIVKYCGVRKERIYTGRKSERLELYKTYTFVRRNEKELMNLQFQAGIVKGFRNSYTQHPKYGSEKILAKIIDTAKIIHTRPLGRVIIDPKSGERTPYYENDFIDTAYGNRVDSGFYHLTLLSSKNDPNMTTKFYLGVQNRRTGPHLFVDDDISLIERVHFYSSAEVDELYLRNRDSGATRNWLKLGCREIRIPIKYTKNQYSNELTALRFSEVGLEDSVLKTCYWRQKDYTHLIDTSFGREGELVLRLLPGEAKLLKVEVCNASIELTGNLDRSNQKKIVAYPTQFHATLDTAIHTAFPVRYHAVYYKNNVGVPPRSKVYYSHSFETPRAFPHEAITWQYPEFPLFDSVRVKNRSNGRWDTLIRPECKYPAIVVRYDSTTFRQKAYIAAVITALPAGVDSISYGENMVVEAILQDIETAAPRLTKMPEVIAHVAAGRNRKITDFGIPTINASAEGNFYAWADSLQGIRVGFKRPNETQFNPNNILSFRWFGDTAKSRTVDPSVNSYSKLRWGENDCSVAWAETPSWRFNDTNSQIYYTQIYWDGQSLERKIPKKDAYIFWSSYNTDSTMIWLSEKPQMNNPDNQTRQNRFPVIYRAIDENIDLCAGCPPLLQTLERVYWQGLDIQFDRWNPRRAIFYVAIDQHDSVYNNKWSPKDWSVQTLYDIMSPTKSLYYPDAAQGRMVERNARTDSALHLNFVSLTNSTNPEIWHISHDWWSMMSVQDFPVLQNDFEDYKYAKKIGPGTYPHLAAVPYVYDESFRWYNRRIFNAGFPPANQPIKSTVQYVFNKEGIGDTGEERFYAFFGYRQDSALRVTHTLPIIKDINDEVKAIGFSKEIDVKTLSTRDTLYSDWFKLEDINFVSFLQTSRTNSKSTYILEKRGGNRFEFGKLPMPNKQINKRKMILTKGGGKEYRFLWIKPQGAQYFEEGVIGNFESALETVEGLYKQGVEDDFDVEVIDLGENALVGDNSIEAFPNPAQDELFFSGQGDENIEVYDLLGQRLLRFEKLSDRRIDISELPVGMYILKVGEAQTKFIKR